MAMTRVPSLDEALALEPLKLVVVLPPRIARRLRIRAHSENRSVLRTATTLLACALVPDAHKRRRLVERDLDDVLGDDRHDAVPVEEQESA